MSAVGPMPPEEGEGVPESVPEGPGAAYRTRELRYRAVRDEATALAGRLSVLRGVVFVAAFACFVLWDVFDGAAAWLAASVGALLAVVFFVLVARHRRARREERWNEILRRLAHEGTHRLERLWEELETVDRRGWPVDEEELRDHPYAADLHVFGRASLVHLAGPVTTAPGRRTLARWLLEAERGDALARRQEGVRELAPEVELRMDVAAFGRMSPPARAAEVERFLAWAEDPPRLLVDRTTTAAAFVLPPLTLLLGGLHLAGLAGPWWIFPLIAQVVVLRRTTLRVRDDFDRSAAAAAGVRRYGDQLRRIHRWAPTAPVLDEIHASLESEAGPAHERLDALGSALDLAESRRSMVYHVLNPFLLLDVHLARHLEGWKARSGADVRGWLEALGRFEALSALGCIAHDHPDWAFPEFDGPGEGEGEGAGGARLVAEDLGHPLLRPDVCRRNDVEVGPPGTFLLVTGSNMSGKSTLLRAVGANVVLAQAGGPVCARSLRLPPVRLHTSMFVEDSLEAGVSRFMAELLRVRGIVAASRENGGAPRVLYLLDEILQGTNSAERRVAARAVIRHLLAEGAMGAVTTHDLTLHEAPDLERRAVMRHFREWVEQSDEGTRLSFDYQLRTGLATTRNALRLLEAVGLSVPEPGDDLPA